MASRAVCLIVLGLLAAAMPARAQQGGGPPVTVAHPLQATVIDYQEFTGRFEATESVYIQARVSGYLDSIHFVDGQIVAEGDLLYTIDPRPFQADLARARAELTRAQSQLQLADVDLGRAEQLATGGNVSRETVDTRRATREVAAADVAAASAAVRAAELELSFTEITAPIAGRISSTRIDVGNLVTGGINSTASVLTTIVSESPIDFSFEISESTYLTFARVRGTREGTAGAETVSLHLLGENTFDRKGKLDFIDNAFNLGTGTIRLRAQFDNPDGLLIPGLFGTLRMASSAPYQALLVPDRAVVSDQNHKLLMTVDAEGKVVPKVVELAGMQDGLRVVRSGLEAGDLVIIDGLLMARPGATVTPQETTLTAQDQN